MRALFQTTILENTWIPKEIRLGLSTKQAKFLLLDAQEALYGGAVGGGKSIALLCGALQYVDYPDYAAKLVRRTYKQLSEPKALLDLARSWLGGTAAKWDAETHSWRFPSGSTVGFSYLDTDRDLDNFQGAAYSYLGVDEITQHMESKYRYLLSRMRRSEGSKIPVRARVTGNPGGIGHYWVYDRFVNDETNEGRPFIQALLDDNPHLDRVEYEKFLSQLDPITYKQLRYGDWNVQLHGGLFEAEWFEGQVVDTLPSDLRYVRYWDLAATEKSLLNPDPDYTVGLKLGVSPDRKFYIADIVRDRTSPAGVEALILGAAEADAIEHGGKRNIGIYIEQEPGSSGKAVAWHWAQRLAGYDIWPDKVTGDKSNRARPVAAQARVKNLYIKRAPWNRALIDELVAFPVGHDDITDALSGAFDKLVVTGRNTRLVAPMSFGGTSKWQIK